MTTTCIRRLASISLVGGGLALALALSGCASAADRADGTAGASRPAAAATVTRTVDASPATDVSPAADESTSASKAAPLSSLLLRKSDLPAGFGTGAIPKTDGASANETLRRCIEPGPPSDQIVDSVTSPSFSETTNGVASTATRYRTQDAADADIALLSAPKAQECFKSVIVNQFAAGSGADASASVEVRPGTNDGPSNEAGVVSVNFTVDEDGRGSQQTISVGMYYLTGPKVVSQLLFIGSGSEFDPDLSTELLGTLAARTAG